MKHEFVIIEDNLDIRRMVSEYFTGSATLDCVMAIDSVERFLKYHRDFFEIKLVLLDVMLGNKSSIYHIPHILQRAPDADIIMFTVMDDSNTIFQALTYGATGYLLKDISMPELEKALLKVLNGEGALLSPAVAKKIIKHFSNPTTFIDHPEAALSEKEKKVTAMLLEGRTYEEIAIRLGISVNGVRYYIKNIYKKLHVSNRGELIRLKKQIDA